MSRKMNQTSGISEDLVENYQECEELIRSLTCCICLEIVKNPYECQNCESLYCFECWDMMKISGKNCVYSCETPIIKAKKFIFDMLGKIRFLCEDCQKHNIPYKTYLRHMQICKLDRKFSTVEESENLLNESKGRLDDLKAEIEKLKFKPLEKKFNPSLDFLKNQDALRLKYLSNQLSTSQKKEIYSTISEGQIDKYKILIETKKYSILEEISAAGYYWTSFHYAMHYGQLQIILYILNYFNKSYILNEVMRLESNDGRCPILCILKSNAVNKENKKKYLEEIFSRFKFFISNEVRRELKNRDFDYMIMKYKLQCLA